MSRYASRCRSGCVALILAAGLATPALTQGHVGHQGPASSAGIARFKVGAIEVSQPWTRATPGGAKIGGGYLRITNTGATPDRLVGGVTPGADHIEIHEMSMTDGVMQMRPLPEGLTIKPGQTVELKPGGYHMMFVDLKQPLKQGATLAVTLEFEKAGKLETEFPVNALGATVAPAMHH